MEYRKDQELNEENTPIVSTMSCYTQQPYPTEEAGVHENIRHFFGGGGGPPYCGCTLLILPLRVSPTGGVLPCPLLLDGPPIISGVPS